MCWADREEFAAALEGKAPPPANQRSTFDDLMDLSCGFIFSCCSYLKKVTPAYNLQLFVYAADDLWFYFHSQDLQASIPVFSNIYFAL